MVLHTLAAQIMPVSRSRCTGSIETDKSNINTTNGIYLLYAYNIKSLIINMYVGIVPILLKCHANVNDDNAFLMMVLYILHLNAT